MSPPRSPSSASPTEELGCGLGFPVGPLCSPEALPVCAGPLSSAACFSRGFSGFWRRLSCCEPDSLSESWLIFAPRGFLRCFCFRPKGFFSAFCLTSLSRMVASFFLSSFKFDTSESSSASATSFSFWKSVQLIEFFSTECSFLATIDLRTSWFGLSSARPLPMDSPKTPESPSTPSDSIVLSKDGLTSADTHSCSFCPGSGACFGSARPW